MSNELLGKALAGTGAVIRYNGKPVVIDGWDSKALKFKVEYDDQWVGWFTLNELILDKERRSNYARRNTKHHE